MILDSRHGIGDAGDRRVRRRSNVHLLTDSVRWQRLTING